MQPITYKLVNKNSEIGFEMMELVNISDNKFWFKCHYTVKFQDKEYNEIDLIAFDEEDYYNAIITDYKIVG